uniref:Uncharacterized protein n=1 Tax=Ursus maritimus TaxID=29073 RepID=A0A452SXT6_URSMA
LAALGNELLDTRTREVRLCPEGTGPSSPTPLPVGGGTLLPQVLTALDRDASCRKHKLRQKLEQIISLVSSNS